jgi:hypothetical protein
LQRGLTFGSWLPFRRDTPARADFPLRDTAGLIAQHVKTEAAKYLGRQSVRITIEGEDHEGLALDLKGEDLHGAVGLWSFTDEEAYFSNVRITPAVPQNLKNESDVAGSWEMRYSSDAGGMQA